MVNNGDGVAIQIHIWLVQLLQPEQCAWACYPGARTHLSFPLRFDVIASSSCLNSVRVVQTVLRLKELEKKGSSFNYFLI